MKSRNIVATVVGAAVIGLLYMTLLGRIHYVFLAAIIGLITGTGWLLVRGKNTKAK